MSKVVCSDSGIEFNSKDGWIKCTDRMPPYYRNVLITCGGNKVGFGYFKEDEGNITHCNHQMLPSDKITHWMPLPEPPTD